MRRSPKAFTPAALALTGLVSVGLLSGCAQQARPVAGAPATAPAPAPPQEPQSEPAYDWAPDVTDEPTPEVPEGRRDRFTKDHMPTDREPTLGEWLWYAVDPPGRRREIALRFAQALQQHDDFGAALEFGFADRVDFIDVGDPQLHAYFADIRRNAGLEHAALCTRSRDLDRDSAVVSCGTTDVVVHVDHMFPGAVVSDWATHEDAFRGPHTHAFTSLTPSDL